MGYGGGKGSDVMGSCGRAGDTMSFVLRIAGLATRRQEEHDGYKSGQEGCKPMEISYQYNHEFAGQQKGAVRDAFKCGW
jgi:hypothetical protein